MPFFHFHLRGGGLDFVDEQGADCRDLAQAHAQARWIAREALLDALEEGRQPRRAVVEVADAAGRTRLVVPLALALPAPTLAEFGRLAAAVRGTR